MQRMQVGLVLAVCFACGFAVKDAFTGYDRERVICPTKSRVWGPGLESDFVVPARYFYIQAVDFENNSFTYSPGENAFQITITPADGRGRIWTQLLDRHDGSFIVRYRMYDTYPELHIEVKSGDRQVADSPYILKGPVYDEKCYCPDAEAQWKENMHCPATVHPQITKDLSLFPSIDIDRLAKEAIERFARHHSLCHYVIVDNTIYRKTHGEHVGFKMFSDAFLTSLARKVHIPDVEFFVNLGDWPLEKRAATDSPLPILSWCGSDETRDIVMPTYDVTESTLETMGRVSLDLLSVQANTGPKWENKTEQGFWRGRDSRQERLDLVKLSRRKPELIDAALTNFFFFKQDDNLYGPKVKHVSFFEFFKYKYQINVDGTVAAYRLPYLLSGDSVVFKHDSIYYEHFYSDLKAWEHYIPFSKDLSDLEERIVWAMEHDEEAHQIAENARTYVRENLLANNIFCYYHQLIKEYAARQTRQPTVRDGMEEVEQPTDSRCTCHRIDPGRDEL